MRTFHSYIPILLGVLAITTACGGRTGLPQGTGETPPVNASLVVNIQGLPDGVAPNVTVSSDSGFSMSIPASGTVTNLTPGNYTVSSGTTRDSSKAALGGTLDPGVAQGLARYPLVLSQTVNVPAGGSASITVTYPQPTFTYTLIDESYTSTSGVNFDFVLIPPGSFQMGSPSNEPGRFVNEDTQHWVTIPMALYVAKTPCTQAQWMAVTGTNPSTWTAAKGGDYTNGEDDFTRPVETVSWNDIRADGAYLSQLRSRTFPRLRLPSEAEYEYAIRAKTISAYFWGDDINNMYPYALAFTSEEGGTGPTVSVGGFSPNAWGLYDMVGNESEWCEDDWHDNYTGAPADGNAWVDSPRGVSRVVRSARFAYNCRSAYRASCTSSVSDYYLGFRVVYSAGTP